MTASLLDAPPARHAQLGGLRLAYRVWGDGPQTVLLIHGITSSSLSWARVATRLAESGRYRAIAPDLKGHGDSDRPVDGYLLADQAQEVRDLCDQLGIDRVAIVGHSWGGA